MERCRPITFSVEERRPTTGAVAVRRYEASLTRMGGPGGSPLRGIGRADGARPGGVGLQEGLPLHGVACGGVGARCCAASAVQRAWGPADGRQGGVGRVQ